MPVDQNFYKKPTETIAQYQSRIATYNASKNPGAAALAPTPSTPLPGLNAPAAKSSLTGFADATAQAVQLAKENRNALLFPMLAQPYQGTLKASDFGSIISNLNRASDTSIQDTLKAHSTTYDTISDANGAIYQVQKDAQGQIIGQPKLVFSGKPNPSGGNSGSGLPGPIKLTAGQQDDIAAMDTLSLQAKQVLDIGQNDNLPGVGALGAGTIDSFVSAKLGIPLSGKAGQHVRDLVGNITATIAKLRGGTSFTPNEQKLLESYSPTINDADPILLQKLKDLTSFIALKKSQTLKVAGGDYSGGSPAASTSSKAASFSGTTKSGLQYSVTF